MAVDLEKKRARALRWYHANKQLKGGYQRRPCSEPGCSSTYVWSKREICNLHQRRVDHTLHRERHRAGGRRWAKNNREKKNNTQNRRRAIGGDFSAAAWASLKALFGHLCAYCRQHIPHLEQDHIVPLVRGGLHIAGNIVPACRSCNAAKGAH
jgi:5-methylcytosine-specific restriction endonuclease McrA